MAAPCGAIILYLANVTGLISLATYYGLTSNAPAQADLPLSAHIGTVIATKTVEAVLNTFAPTVSLLQYIKQCVFANIESQVHHTLRIDAPPPPALSVTLYPIKSKFSAPATFLLSSGETFVSSGTEFTSSHTPFSILPQLLAGLLCILMSLMLLYVCADFLFAVRERVIEIIATRLAEDSKRLKAELFNERLVHEKKLAVLRETYSAVEEKLAADHAIKMNRLEDKHSEEVRNHDTKMAELRKHNLVEEDKLNMDHSTKMNEARDAHSTEKDKLRDDNSAEIRNIKDAHSAEKDIFIKDHCNDMEQLKDQHSVEKREHNTEVVELGKQNIAEEENLNTDHPTNIANIKEAQSVDNDILKNGLRNNNSAETKPFSPDTAAFTPAASPGATAFNTSSISHGNTTGSCHADASRASSTSPFEDKPPPVNPAVYKDKIESLARSLSHSSSKSTNRHEISQGNHSSNRFSALSVDQSEETDQAAPTEINIGGDAPLRYNVGTVNDMNEIDPRPIAAPLGPVDTDAGVESSGWQEAKPKKPTRRGNRAGRAEKEKRQRYMNSVYGGGR